MQNENGVVSLVASESIHLGAESDIEAQGGDTVVIKSGNTFSDEAGSKISATGGPKPVLKSALKSPFAEHGCRRERGRARIIGP